MRKLFVLSVMLAVGFSCAAAQDKKGSSKIGDRVVSAAVVLKEVAGIPEKGIPTDLLNKCVCVAVIPSEKKGGFMFGGYYGRGVIACRTNHGEGPWSGPSMISLTGGSFGLQLGGQAVDMVLVIMNLSGLESLLDSKFTLGGDVSVAAGPVGRTAAAETDAWLSAKILAYSRARGLFGGLVVKGGTLRPDNEANQILYGKEIRPKTILFTPTTDIPRDGKIFVDELTRISPKHVK